MRRVPLALHAVSRIALLSALIPALAAAQGAPGLAAVYFNESEFAGASVAAPPSDVAFDFLEGSPDPAIEPNSFTARYTGYINPLYSEVYRLWTRSDDGVRLFVDGQLVIDNWTPHAPTVDEASVPLRANVPVPVMLEYFEQTGGALIELGWESLQQGEETIPADRMSSASPFPPGLPIVSITSPDTIATEGTPDTAVATVSRWGDLSQPLSVDLALGGTAEQGLDFTPFSTRVELRANQSSVRITVSRPDNPTYSGRRVVEVSVAASANYTVGAASVAAVTLIDDETPPRDPVYVVTGTVTTGPEIDGEIVVQALDASEAVAAQQVLLDDGTYALAGLEPGTYTARAFLDADGDRVLDVGELEGVGPSEQGRVSVTLPPDALEVHFALGNVPSADAAPLADAAVVTDSSPASDGSSLADAGPEGDGPVTTDAEPAVDMGRWVDDVGVGPADAGDPAPATQSAGGCAQVGAQKVSCWGLYGVTLVSLWLSRRRRSRA